MDHMAAVQARIAAIRGLVESSRPAGARGGTAFQAALETAMGDKAQVAAPGGVPAADAAESASMLSFAAFGGSVTGAARPPLGQAPLTQGLRAPVQARISSRFGPRVHPVTGERHNHAGVDFAAPAGTPVQAVAAGTVRFAGERGGYGNLVIVAHPDGTESWYAHQRDLGVRAGQRVEAGAVLGTVGSTGRSTGPHLHLEVRRGGAPIDPLPLLGGGGLTRHAHAHG